MQKTVCALLVILASVYAVCPDSEFNYAHVISSEDSMKAEMGTRNTMLLQHMNRTEVEELKDDLRTARNNKANRRPFNPLASLEKCRLLAFLCPQLKCSADDKVCMMDKKFCMYSVKYCDQLDYTGSPIMGKK